MAKKASKKRKGETKVTETFPVIRPGPGMRMLLAPSSKSGSLFNKSPKAAYRMGTFPSMKTEKGKRAKPR